MNKGSLLHHSSTRFAFGLWAGSVLALYAVFLFQIEPAQWAGVTVWIMFMQTPRLNYAKLIYWSMGTIGGAVFGIWLIDCFNQDRFLFLSVLTLWLSGCAYIANLVKSYNAYGAVLAGYTAAIVSLSSIDRPEQVFTLALDRVACIFIGMAAAILAMAVFLPRHPHWKDTLHRLRELTREVCAQAAASMRTGDKNQVGDFAWAKVSTHLSLLEHTLEPTTAETADSRIRAGATRSAVASLCCLLAKAESIRMCLDRQAPAIPSALQVMLIETQSLLGYLSTGISESFFHDTEQAIGRLRPRIKLLLSDNSFDDQTSHFVLLRLGEVLTELESVLKAWVSLHSPKLKAGISRLREHRDHSVALTAALRMALAMSIASIFWVATGWPAGNQFVLFTAIICSLLTLQEDPRNLGWRFIAGACFSGVIAFIDVFWLLQLGEGFLLLAFVLGLFLVPAAYFYRRPSLFGGAIPSMLLFYNLVVSSNQMSYDIEVFLNNALGCILAIGFAFFAFHAVMPPSPPVRCANILRAIWRDIEEMAERAGTLSEQGWTSLICDRIRLLHRFANGSDLLANDAEACIGLQLGLRRMRLQSLFAASKTPALCSVLRPVLNAMRRVSSSPEMVSLAVARCCRRLREPHLLHNDFSREALAELFELDFILRARITHLHV